MYPLTASISPEDSQCDWPDTEENRRRAVFCAHMDMQLSNFEELCRCKLMCLSVCLFVCLGTACLYVYV